MTINDSDPTSNKEVTETFFKKIYSTYNKNNYEEVVANVSQIYENKKTSTEYSKILLRPFW